ncbi:MAG: hypothetical protein OEY89_10050 [Gammaproteobacteria bacterium]|nr:hypothetical protein [Gammaproteobacteria bacterium]
MSYIKLLPTGLLLLVSACGQAPVRDNNDTLANSGQQEQQAASRLSTDERALYKQAITALYNNKLSEAEGIFMGLIKKRPHLAGPWANLALIKYKNNEIEQSTNYVNKALELNPAMANALNLKAQLEIRNGHIKEAENLYLVAIQNNSSYANAHYNIALLYDIYLQDIEKAVKHYKRYTELTENKDTATIEWVQQLESSLNNS